jgi:truncated hemoglobin YjbI
MNIEVITKEDLQNLRRELLEDLKQFLAGPKHLSGHVAKPSG